MKRTSVILLLVVWCVRGEMFAPGRQWTYSYHALLRAGALLPAEAHSQWDLQGRLEVRGGAGSATAAVRLAGLRSATYNGPRDSHPPQPQSQPAELPGDIARALETPFLVHYTSLGTAEALSVSRGDPLWAVNIKRSIASVLQLRQDRLSEPASLVAEHGLHGLCQQVEYSVVNNTGYVYLRKTIDGARCELPPLSWSSATAFACAGAEEQAYAATTTREYTLAHKPDGRLELEHIMSSRRLYVQPFRAAAEAHQVYQYQLYRLLSSSAAAAADTPPEPVTDYVRRPLTFEHESHDLTQGRARSEQQNALRQVQRLLDRLVSTLDGPSRLDRSAGTVHNRLLTQLYYAARMLELASLQRLYDDIAIGTSYQLETKRNMFLELLPQIGTAASAHFMRDLVLTHRLKDLASIKLLAVFPFYVRYSDETLLRDMEPLLHLGNNYDPTIRQTAVLSFATLVHRTHTAGRCTNETLEQYARKYLDMFAEASGRGHGQRMAYLQALDNLQSGSAFRFLTSLIANGEQCRHLRFLAVWAVLPLAPQHPAEAYRLFWPLLVDRTQRLEMRVAALTVLLVSQPSEARLLTLYWYMRAERDHHLRHFFHSTIMSLQRTTYPCYAHLARLARQVARFVRRPAPAWTTANYLLDYRDMESAFGGMAQLFLIGQPTTGAPDVVYLTFNNYATGRNLNQVALYLKLQGLGEHLMAQLHSTTSSTTLFQTVVKVLENAEVTLPLPEDLHLELIVKVQGKSVFCQFIDGDNFNKLMNALKHLDIFLAYHMNYQSIFLPYLSEHAEPSDVGTLVLRGIVSNSVASVRGNSTSAYELDLDLRYYTYTTSFLESYSPLWNTWHGVHKSRSLQARLLLNGTVQVRGGGGLRVTAAHRPEYLSAALYSHTQTYILGDGETAARLRAHCRHCSPEHTVRVGAAAPAPAPAASQPLLSLNVPALATGLHVELFDCERGQQHGRLFADVLAAHDSNTQILPSAAPFLYALHVLDRITYVLPHRSCGIWLSLRPLHNDLTKVVLELLMQQSSSSPSEQSESEAELSSVTGVVLTHRRSADETVLQSWNGSVVMSPAADWSKLSLNVSMRHVNALGHEQTVCIELDGSAPSAATAFTLQEETLLRASVRWAELAATCSTALNNGTAMEATFAFAASPSEESRRLWQSSESWPFAECRRDSDRAKSTSFSIACYTAAQHLALDNRYTLHFNLTDAARWMQGATSQLGSWWPSPEPLAANISTVRFSLDVSPAERNVTFGLNGARASLGMPAVALLEPLLPLLPMLWPWPSDTNNNRECLVSAHQLWTMDNRTLPLEEVRKKDVLLAAECSRWPRFALFLDAAGARDELAFTLHAARDTVTVRPSPAAVLVTVNELPLGDATRTPSGLSVQRLPGDALSLGAPGLALHYTRTHMLVRHRALLPVRLCGLCSHH